MPKPGQIPPTKHEASWCPPEVKRSKRVSLISRNTSLRFYLRNLDDGTLNLPLPSNHAGRLSPSDASMSYSLNLSFKKRSFLNLTNGRGLVKYSSDDSRIQDKHKSLGRPPDPVLGSAHTDSSVLPSALGKHNICCPFVEAVE